jgi:hypothetical protein
MRTSIRAATAGAVALLTFIPGTAAVAAPSDLVRVSRGDPFAGCDIGGTPTSTVYRGAEVEPYVTTDQRRPGRVVAAWQQGRWSDGGAQGLVAAWSADGGRSFQSVPWPVSRCARGGLNYERATDPWVSTGPDGIVYGSALSFDANTPNNAVVAVTSYDGGRTWRNTTELIRDTEIEFFNDKNSVTADPTRRGTAYQVWDRLESGPGGATFVAGPTLLSVTRDGGRTWSRPRVIVDMAPFQQTIGNVVVVDLRGTVYNFYTSIQYTDETASEIVFSRFEVVRSTDGGRTWGRPIVVAPDTSLVPVNPNNPDQVLRTSFGLAFPAVDPHTGQLYLAYEGSDFSRGRFNEIELVSSTDGGRSWSRPIRVNRPTGLPAHTPSIAVTDDGDVGITYYDMRTLRPGTTRTLPTSTWLTISPRGGERFGRERSIAPVFDHLQAPFAGGYFLGDYEGLATVDDRFRALFVITNSNRPGNSTDVYYGQFPSIGAPHEAADATPSERAAAAPATARKGPLRSRL